jgi:hypothetical protein
MCRYLASVPGPPRSRIGVALASFSFVLAILAALALATDQPDGVFPLLLGLSAGIGMATSLMNLELQKAGRDRP